MPHFRFVELEREAPIVFVFVVVVAAAAAGFITFLKPKKWSNRWCLRVV